MVTIIKLQELLNTDLVNSVSAALFLKDIDNEVKQVNDSSCFEIFKSDLDLLMKRYHLERSYLERLADWYNNRSFWQNALLIGSVICCVLCSTMLLNLLAIITVSILITINTFALIICFGLKLLLTNHGEVEQRRCERMFADINQLENNLATSIQAFINIENRLLSLLSETEKRNEILSNHANSLEQQVDTLKIEAKKFETIISELTDTHQAFQKETQKIREEDLVLKEKLAELQKAIEQNTANLLSEDEQLVATRQEIAQSTTFLTSIHKTLSVIHQSCENRTKLADETCTQLEEEEKEEQKVLARLESTSNHNHAKELPTEQLCKEATRRKLHAQALLMHLEQRSTHPAP